MIYSKNFKKVIYMAESWKKMVAAALSIVTLAVVDLTGIAVINVYKSNALIDNTTADQFITGLTYFGAFIGLMVVAVVGKMVIGLFRAGE
jgi:hypothetical protein